MADIILRKYGVQTTVDFALYDVTGTAFKTDASHASGDVKIMKDEGSEATATNGFTDEGTGYSIVVTATEMQAARVVLYIADQGSKVWIDKQIIIETYGHASAMHAFDLDTATQDVNIASLSANVLTSAATANDFYTQFAERDLSITPDDIADGSLVMTEVVGALNAAATMPLSGVAPEDISSSSVVGWTAAFAARQVITPDADLHANDLSSGSPGGVMVQAIIDGVGDLLSPPTLHFKVSSSPLSYNGNDYKDTNFGVTGNGQIFLGNSVVMVSADNTYNAEFDISEDWNCGLVDALYNEGQAPGEGGPGEFHTRMTLLITSSQMTGQGVSVNGSGMATLINTYLTMGGGGGNVLSSVTCDNFKEGYAHYNGATSNWSITTNTGWENGGTGAVTVCSGFTSPPTYEYDPQAPIYLGVKTVDFSDEAKAMINAEVVDVIETDTHAELASLPGTTPTTLQMVQYNYEYFRHKRDNESTGAGTATETLYKNDGTTALGTSSETDDGTTFTKGKVS